MDKKILKEWEKIKEYNIFSNIEELKKLFIECPKGKCMRKFPSYPWTKENFFFGTAQDLLYWYKNTNEIPFYVNDYIKKKYGFLTIIDFTRNKEKNNELMAICKCDCGNTATFIFRNLRHGDYVSCGCKAKKTKFISLYDNFKKLVDEKWDYEKNLENPQEISYDTEKKYWWKGYKHSFLMSPKSFFVKSNGTSFPEQTILFYLKSIFKNVYSRHKLNIDEKKYETDIFIKDCNVAIEYDGYVWHKNKYKEDEEKSKKIISQNITLIRIRESGLINIELENLINIESDIENLNYFKALSSSINSIFKVLYKITLNDKLFNKTISAEDIKNDKIKIENQYLIGYEKNNIESNFLSNFWSKDNSIEKYKISTSSEDKFYFKCNAKNKIFISPKSITNIYKKLDENQKIEFENTFLINKQCPFIKMKECPCNALYHEKINKPCKYFKDYNEELLIKPINIFNDIDIIGEKNLRITEYKTIHDKYINFLKTLEIGSNSNKIEQFRKFIQNLTFYKMVDFDDILSRFIETNIPTKEKIEYIEQTFVYPHLTITDIAKCFNNQNLRNFYFNNINYNEIQKDEDSLILNYLHSYYIIDLLKQLVYSNKPTTLFESLNIIHKHISQNAFDKIIKSIIISLILKNRYQLRELKVNKKNFDNIIDAFIKNCSIKDEIKKIIEMDLHNIIVFYMLPFLKKQLKNTSLNKDYFVWLSKFFKDDTEIFFNEINKEISLENEHLLTIFKKELYFNKQFYNENKISKFDSEIFFDKDFIPNLIKSNKKDEYTIFNLIVEYAQYFSYGKFDINGLKNPELVYILLRQHGFSHLIFDISIFNDKVDLLFDFIMDIYDKKFEDSEKLINTDNMINMFEKAIKENLVSKYFIQRCKETMIYLQQKNKRKTNSFIWINGDLSNFNELIGINI